MKSKREYIIENLIPLNHDRFKSYFTQFLVVHLGLFTALCQQCLSDLRWVLFLLALVLSIAWFLVLYKIRSDIRHIWDSLKTAEEDVEETERITAIPATKMPASRVMLLIPVAFLTAYVALSICL